MGEDPEKRFHSIMDKLFHYLPPKSLSSGSSNGVQLSRSKKRSNPESALALVEPRMRGDLLEGSSQLLLGSSEAPLCRPWDRGDLMRRLATFKSMTWFAKPKVVSAVNSARRGWINVDMDIIACETCGARLLFSTPSSWTQQQVEKAALVFSLKLDNGHKLNCPWIDNACEERLAEFPPTPPPVLVDKFRERSSALLQLLALPVISSSAIENMRSHQLEEFLGQSPTLECSNEFVNLSQIESLGPEHEDDSANLYYQAQKLISLCGWEPRSLPYVVDCKERPYQLLKDGSILKSSHIVANGQDSGISVNSATNDESVEGKEDCRPLNVPDADPNSVVLDCRLCGASVGLWTFKTVARPVELFRLVGYTDVHSKKNSSQDSGNENHVDNRVAVVNSASNGSLASTEQPSNLNLTIAGGPLPMKQNFKATISFPVIGRNLRARFSYDSDFRDRSYDNQEVTRSEPENNNLLPKEKVHTECNICEQVSLPEAVELLKGKTHDQGQCSYASSDQPSHLNLDNCDNGTGLGEENDSYISFEGIDITGEGTFPEIGMHNSIMESPMQSTPEVVQGSGQSDILLENAHNVGSLDSTVEVFGSSEVGTSSVSDPDANVTVQNGQSTENDSLVMITSNNPPQEQISEADILCGKDISSKTDSRDRETCSDCQNIVGAQAKSQEGVAYNSGKDLGLPSLDKSMEFDPVRQHRHFCPWILSTSSRAPGWQQTLSALQRPKEHSNTSPTNSPSSASIIKVDDPITSVRKLFTSPTAKRMKPTCGSS